MSDPTTLPCLKFHEQQPCQPQWLCMNCQQRKLAIGFRGVVSTHPLATSKFWPLRATRTACNAHELRMLATLTHFAETPVQQALQPQPRSRRLHLVSTLPQPPPPPPKSYARRLGEICSDSWQQTVRVSKVATRRCMDYISGTVQRCRSRRPWKSRAEEYDSSS